MVPAIPEAAGEKRRPEYDFKRVDWKLRDISTLEQLKIIVDKIYNDTNKPKRITIHRLSYETGIRYLDKASLEKMPKTSEYLKEILESFDDIRIRKIKWAINEILKSTDEVLNITNIRIKAGIRTLDNSLKERIKEEIEKIDTLSKT